MGFRMTETEVADLQRRGIIPLETPPVAELLREIGKARKANAKREPQPARIRLVIELPGVIIKSEPNIGGKLHAKLARKAAVKDAIRAALREVAMPQSWEQYRVKLIRVGGKKLDGDNLQTAMKPVRDCIAEWQGEDDGDSRFRWSYSQRPGYWSGIIIEIG